MFEHQPILTLVCPDQPGIVAAVTTFLADNGCNILQSAQFDDIATNRFFMRLCFSKEAGTTFTSLKEGFAPIGHRFDMKWHLYDAQHTTKILIMCSKMDHCLLDLLHRQKRGELRADIRAVVSNHEDSRPLTASYDIPYHHFPITKEIKKAQEQRLRDLIEEEEVELIILARYMQVLSEDFCRDYEGRLINIHHSFLPSFKGARPYHQAHDKGVKLIGATAHFVTADLDEGPIIEQGVERVDHAMTPHQFIETGRDIERQTLAKAVKYFIEKRVLLNGSKTVVFR
ncbi:MAG: formyltetrahydrofolate deformylase [Pseudomonadota bacterium]